MLQQYTRFNEQQQADARLAALPLGELFVRIQRGEDIGAILKEMVVDTAVESVYFAKGFILQIVDTVRIARDCDSIWEFLESEIEKT